MKISEFINAEIERIEAEEGYPPEELSAIAEKVKSEYKTDCVLSHIGGYDSTGYDLDCYAFAYIENGTLTIHGYEHESY
ncbi:hypothetical protein [Peribacillus frigoritolerans]|uniref:hypothetical protein n=1 Tax=Peribacillus frigoritolerans TaxID=450367 RepID=UPI002E2515CE|nr:hypothetical protein [Peribacillus frigoritolerans]MED3845565.1 hypothetical protein [Peribacillus frigoritolerans]